MKLKDQVAMVTGGGMGIGAEVARLFAEEGARVVIADWNEDAAGQSAERVRAAGGQAEAVRCDVSSREEARGAVEHTVQTFGRIDVLINNAGITRDSSALKMEPHQWDQVLGVNLTGVFNCAVAAAAHMREQKYGRICNASSVSAFGNFGQANYAATKSGLIGLTKTLAVEWARYGITVNAVAPGYTQTAMTEAIPQELREAQIQRIPVGRPGEPIDIARAYLFFASPESSYITGQLLVVDGGQTLPH